MKIKMSENSRPTPYEVARDLYGNRYHGAEVLFVAGSIRRNEATATSDIDLVVVFPKLEHAYRESFMHQGWPVEAFVHDPESLNYFFWEIDAKDGTPSLACMVVEGQPLPEANPLVNKLKSLADQVLQMGPAKYSDDQLKNARYGINDLLDDLRCPRNHFEAKAIGAKLHEQLGDFWFRAQGKWSASDKHIPRRMQKLDPAFAQTWVQAFDMAFGGDARALIRMTETVLDQFGGAIFDGYRRDAPREWKKALPPSKNIFSDFRLSPLGSGLLSDETVLEHSKLGKIEVRLAELDDVQSLRKLLNAAYKRLADLGLNYNATFQDDELTAEGLADGRTFVLDLNGQLVGTMKLRKHNYIDERPCLYLSRFAVRPDLQGQGLGMHLLELAEQIAKREGFLCMQLDTAQPAEHLVVFYQKFGFQIRRPIYYEGKTYCSWILEKPL